MGNFLVSNVINYVTIRRWNSGHTMRCAEKETNPLVEGLLGENGVQQLQQLKLGGVLRSVGGKTVVVGVEHVETTDDARRHRGRQSTVVLLVFVLRRRRFHDLCSYQIIKQ